MMYLQRPRPRGELLFKNRGVVLSLLPRGSKDVASLSRPENVWQPSFKFGDGLLPSTESIKTWDKGHRGRMAQSLVHGLLLLEDVQFFTEGDEDSLVRRL